MPYSVSNPPRPAKNWTDAEKKKCVAAANAVLGDGGSEEDAIYACVHAAGKSKKKMTDKETKETKEEGKEQENKSMYYVPFGVTSFAALKEARLAQEQADEMLDLVSDFRSLVFNVLDSDEITDKASAIKSLANEFDTLISEAESGVSEKGVDEVDEGLIDRFINWAKGLKTRDKEQDHDNGLMFFKNKDGQWTWFARYSNKFRDDDRPVKEIIAESSHLRFVDLVKSGEADYPELWLWHDPRTSWGKATWAGYDSEGFALAAGYVYPEFGEVAAALKGRDDILLSHGMPKGSIRRDADDPSIIVEHVTKEISVLPSWAAANKLTFFLLEDNMNEQKSKGISPEDQRRLVEELGIPEATIESMLARNHEDANKAAEIGLESKEAATEEVKLEGGSDEVEAQEETQVEAELQEGAGAEETSEEVAEEATEEVAEEATPQEESPAQVNLADSEFAQGLIKALGDFSNNIKALNERLDALDNEVKALSDATTEMKGTPAASFASQFARSVIGAEETRVDGRTRLAKDAGPAENDGNDDGTFFFNKWMG